jgi:hypothetical protein
MKAGKEWDAPSYPFSSLCERKTLELVGTKWTSATMRADGIA